MLIRHYFPGVRVEELPENEFYRLIADVEWLEERKMIQTANAIARAFGGNE